VLTSRPINPFRIAAAALLLALVTVALPLKAGQPRHLHQAPSAGLYNEEHVLAGLEFLGGDVPLPDPPPGVFVALVLTACVLATGAHLAAPPRRLSDPRAPPLA